MALTHEQHREQARTILSGVGPSERDRLMRGQARLRELYTSKQSHTAKDEVLAIRKLLSKHGLVLDPATQGGAGFEFDSEAPTGFLARPSDVAPSEGAPAPTRREVEHAASSKLGVSVTSIG